VRAEEATSALASVSSTVLSGYVDTSAQWNLGTGDSHAPAYKYGGASKADGFNLDVVKLTLEKPLDEAEWAAGYKVDLFLGPDADTLGTQSTLATGRSDFAIKQAYVALRAPVGNGLDFKMGVFDSIIGYESTEAINNPNFSRSWGHSFEPSTHTGLLATYRFSKEVAISAGVADTANFSNPAINSRATSPSSLTSPGINTNSFNESYKTYMASVALTAPDDWGFLSGSTLYAGIVNGWNTTAAMGDGEPQTSYYLGTTIATPVTGLRAGFSLDYVQLRSDGITGTPAAAPVTALHAYPSFGAHSFAGYISYQASEKLSLHGRAEYSDVSSTAASFYQSEGIGIASSVFALTGTIQYDLWKNVLSRFEIRWDHALDGTESFGGTNPAPNPGRYESGHYVTGTAVNAWTLAANVIYKF
jgi:hypothetical protein